MCLYIIKTAEMKTICILQIFGLNSCLFEMWILTHTSQKYVSLYSSDILCYWPSKNWNIQFTQMLFVPQYPLYLLLYFSFVIKYSIKATIRSTVTPSNLFEDNPCPLGCSKGIYFFCHFFNAFEFDLLHIIRRS